MVISVETPKKIRVDLSTRDALEALGRKGDSYDDVIVYLIGFREVVLKNYTSLSDEAVRRMLLEERG